MAGTVTRPHLKITQNRWYRILGVAFVMYVLSFIDRTNIAMAIPSLRRELGLSQASIGFATGTFFWGYILLQIPAGRLASTWSAKRVIAILLILWSAVSVSTALVQTEWQLILNRFVLGVTEGGVLTAVIVLNRAWFAPAERARANTIFLASLAIAPMLANPISGLVLSHVSWRWMFVVEGFPSLLWGIVWWWAIADTPETAAWLPPAERTALLARLAAEAPPRPIEGHWSQTLLQPAVLLLALYNFLALMAEYGVIFWMPTVLRETGLSIAAVGWLSAIPYGAGAITMVLVAVSSDRMRERKWHMMISSALSGVFPGLGAASGTLQHLGDLGAPHSGERGILRSLRAVLDIAVRGFAPRDHGRRCRVHQPAPAISAAFSARTCSAFSGVRREVFRWRWSWRDRRSSARVSSPCRCACARDKIPVYPPASNAMPK